MKWAKYFGLLLLSFCLFYGLSPLKQAKAASITITDSGFIVYKITDNQYQVDFILYNIQNEYSNSFDYGTVIYSATKSSLSDAVDFGNLALHDFDRYINTSMNLYNLQYGYNPVYLYNLPYLNTGLEPTPPEPDDPTWWDKVKEAFMDFVGSEALSDILSGDWLSYIDDVLFGELWTVKVGEGEDDMIIPETVSATPTPSPTPIPTPIQYSTVIDPGTGEIHYHYTIDISGTPVPTSSIYPPVTSSPPGPGSGSTIDEPVAVEDYYEPEDSLSVPKLRIFKFLLRMTGNDVDVGMDSLDDNMAVMDATLEDNAEAISGVGDLFQLIPVKWFILIGTLACFPVIAAMIKSLLGG